MWIVKEMKRIDMEIDEMGIERVKKRQKAFGTGKVELGSFRAFGTRWKVEQEEF